MGLGERYVVRGDGYGDGSDVLFLQVPVALNGREVHFRLKLAPTRGLILCIYFMHTRVFYTPATLYFKYFILPTLDLKDLLDFAHIERVQNDVARRIAGLYVKVRHLGAVASPRRPRT